MSSKIESSEYVSSPEEESPEERVHGSFSGKMDLGRGKAKKTKEMQK